MDFFSLTEGLFWIGKNQKITLIESAFDTKPENAIKVGINVFVLRMDNEIILFDAGIRHQHNSNRLVDKLLEKNISPTHITKIFLTHCHYDHIANLAYYDIANKQYHLTFPNATIFVHKNNLDTFYQAYENQFYGGVLACIKNSNQVIYLNEIEEQKWNDMIFWEYTNGHCLNHVVFKIIINNKIYFFGGDEAPQLNQMQYSILTKYDANPALAMEYRKKWWQQGKNENWTFLFYHDVSVPIFSFSV